MLHQHPGGLKLTQRVADMFGLPVGARIADIGCGEGDTVAYLRERYHWEATGLDASLERLSRGRRRFAGVPLLQGRAEKLPFAASTLDGVIMECSLSLMGDLPGVVKEVGRVLTVGGKWGITDLYAKRRSRKLAPRRDGLPIAADEAALADFIKLLAANGLVVTKAEDHSLCLRNFVARFIMQQGSAAPLRACSRLLESNAFPGGAATGYLFMLVEKRAGGEKHGKEPVSAMRENS
jgi:ubiquinone/menaquinone biosynthesis C-methylase UbiE